MSERKRIRLSKQVEVTIPMLPNFIKMGTELMPLYAFEDSELRAIGEAWTEGLIEQSKKQATLHRNLARDGQERSL